MTTARATSFKQRLEDGPPLVGMWVASGSPYCAEICAGSGLGWLLLDSEHAPNDVRSLLAQLQAVAAYDVHPVVRPPSGDPVLLKQLLDIGAQNLLVPLVESAEQAEQLVRATRYPPAGIRGVGATLARASRWGRDTTYLGRADDEVTLVVQVETRRGLEQLSAIASVDGVDGVFVGPADLAASFGQLGNPGHPDVVAAVEAAIRTVVEVGKPVGVNAFVEQTARRYLELGCRFVLVGSDVTLLAQGSDWLATTYST